MLNSYGADNRLPKTDRGESAVLRQFATSTRNNSIKGYRSERDRGRWSRRPQNSTDINRSGPPETTADIIEVPRPFTVSRAFSCRWFTVGVTTRALLFPEAIHGHGNRLRTVLCTTRKIRIYKTRKGLSDQRPRTKIVLWPTVEEFQSSTLLNMRHPSVK